jgi:hypothetical protein
MEVKAGPYKGRLKICSESLKEANCEYFIAQLRKMAYGDQGITMNFIMSQL